MEVWEVQEPYMHSEFKAIPGFPFHVVCYSEYPKVIT